MPPPPDTEYYELLGVSWEATQAEIKKGYYKVALKYHPDKNQGDAEAAEKFKKVSEAYQVLSNTELKERYDKFGKDAAKDHPEINAKELFNALFGGGKFEDYVGELSVVSEMENMAQNSGAADGDVASSQPAGGPSPQLDNMTEEQQKQREEQRAKRIKKLTSQLIVRLQPFVDGKSNEFEANIKAEALELQDESFGADMLEAIGYVYELKSQQQLSQVKLFGIQLSNPYHYTREKVHTVKSAVNVITSMVDMQVTAQEIQKHEEKGTLNEDMRAQFETDAAAKMMAILWRVNKLEIETVLREVCTQVLSDEGIDKKSQKLRAEGLRLIGKMFRKVAKDSLLAAQRELQRQQRLHAAAEQATSSAHDASSSSQ